MLPDKKKDTGQLPVFAQLSPVAASNFRAASRVVTCERHSSERVVPGDWLLAMHSGRPAFSPCTTIRAGFDGQLGRGKTMASISPQKFSKKAFAFLALVMAPILLAEGRAGMSQSGPAVPSNSSNPPQTPTPMVPGHAEPQAPRRNVIPDSFTNLKVLPKDIKKPELMNMMKGFSMQLGKRCRFCHEVNDDLSEGDFASDKKIEKETARVMIKMMAEINQEFLAKLPEMPAEATCWTCHRGKNKPEKFVPPEMPAGGPPRPNSSSAPPDAQRKDASPNTQSSPPPK